MSNSSISKKEVYLVRWKQQKNHVEIFDSLEVFAASYPRYDLSVLTDALAFGKTVFEDEAVYIEKKAIVSAPKPDFPRMFFWEFNYDRIDWMANASTVIQRVLERGSAKHWDELVRYYSKDTIINFLKERITFLPDECIDEASLFFNLNKEDMLCYKRKLSQKIPWL
ncbi:DUF6922 domain-containing protein [Niabella beijingensis]|nr:hypothetical protein [Niabella beijingensis]MBZ4191550.1 hypothetical protein [Niabella beijingensis]